MLYVISDENVLIKLDSLQDVISEDYQIVKVERIQAISRGMRNWRFSEEQKTVTFVENGKTYVAWCDFQTVAICVDNQSYSVVNHFHVMIDGEPYTVPTIIKSILIKMENNDEAEYTDICELYKKSQTNSFGLPDMPFKRAYRTVNGKLALTTNSNKKININPYHMFTVCVMTQLLDYSAVISEKSISDFLEENEICLVDINGTEISRITSETVKNFIASQITVLYEGVTHSPHLTIDDFYKDVEEPEKTFVMITYSSLASEPIIETGGLAIKQQHWIKGIAGEANYTFWNMLAVSTFNKRYDYLILFNNDESVFTLLSLSGLELSEYIMIDSSLVLSLT